MTERAFLKHPLKALVEEKYGLEFEEFTNPWHAAISSFIAFVLGSLPPMLSIILLPKRNPDPSNGDHRRPFPSLYWRTPVPS